MLGLKYDRLLCLDFEFRAPDGERPDPVSLAALELRTGKEFCWRREQLGSTPPFDVSGKSLIFGFAIDAELECFEALQWQPPVNTIDCRIEWKMQVNCTPRLTLSKKERKH